MYEAHFGLEKSLFGGGIAHESAVFMGPRQQQIAAKFGVALTTYDSVIVLTGPAGVGKTTLTAAALRMTHTRVALGWLPSTPTNGAELLEALLAEFGQSAHRVGRIERQQMWRQFVSEMSATDTRVFVIAEHADTLEIGVLRALEAATAADPNGCPGANVILLGQAELAERLNPPALASLRQRVRLRQSLEPFSPLELEAYLRRRVADAGGAFDRVFGPGAAAALHRFTDGLPRALHNLCETGLTLAAAEGAERVTAELIATIATEHFGLGGQSAGKPDGAPQARPGDDFPVLTDAVDEAAAARRPAAQAPAPVAAEPAPPSKRAATGTAPRSKEATPAAPSTATALAAAMQPAAARAASDDDEEAHRTQTLRALARAKSIDDVSSSMAESLFGDADLDMLSAAFASAGWDDDAESDDLPDEGACSSVEEAPTMETPRGAFAAFGRKREPELALAEEPLPPVPAAKAAAKR